MRPGRPIPSGRVRPRSAIIAGLALWAAGWGCAAFSSPNLLAAGSALAVLVLVYTFVAKSVPILGPLCMGGCRGLSLLLGAAAAAPSGPDWMLALPAALVLLVYVAAVTDAARRETRPTPARSFRGPLLILLIGLTWCATNLPPQQLPVIGLLAAGLAALFTVVAAARPWPENAPRSVGLLISVLIFLQAAFLATAGAPVLAMGWLAIWPLFRGLNRWFPSS
jgi:4-hydroxybenzoate polyprenyltransferase